MNEPKFEVGDEVWRYDEEYNQITPERICSLHYYSDGFIVRREGCYYKLSMADKPRPESSLFVSWEECKDIASKILYKKMIDLNQLDEKK